LESQKGDFCIMKILFLLSITAAFSENLTAQATYSVFTYKEPTGYTKEKKQGFISYTKTNQTKGTYCIIAFYEPSKANTTINESFDANWQELVAQPYNVTNAPQKENQSDINGWKVKVGGTNFTFSGGPCAAFLTTMQQGIVDANILYISNTEDYLTDFDALMSSLKMSKANPPIATTTAPTIVATVPGNQIASSKPELWFTYTLSGTKYQTLEPKFYLVYPNGDFKDEAPWEGLLSFNANQNKKQFPLGWGKFQMNKNRVGSFTYMGYVEKVIKISDDKMDRPDASWDYMKCKSVNGLKLQGSYSPQKDWSTNTYFNSQTCKNLLTLNKDGSFVDHGYFVGICDNPSTNAQDAPGSGTYTIKDFTLQLKYKDGRITERLLCGLGNANPFIENESIFIGHQIVYKK
jgi:hypothetical protein